MDFLFRLNHPFLSILLNSYAARSTSTFSSFLCYPPSAPYPFARIIITSCELSHRYMFLINSILLVLCFLYFLLTGVVLCFRGLVCFRYLLGYFSFEVQGILSLLCKLVSTDICLCLHQIFPNFVFLLTTLKILLAPDPL